MSVIKVGSLQNLSGLTEFDLANQNLQNINNISSGGTLNIPSNITTGGTINASSSISSGGTISATSNISSTGSVIGSLVFDSVGNLRNIPINNQSTTYTVTASDLGKIIVLNSGSSGATVSANIFSIGDSFAIYNNTGGSVALTQGSGTSLTWAGFNLTGSRTLYLSALCTVICISSNTFILLGIGIA